MTTAVQQLLASFDQLSRADQLCVVREIQDRILGSSDVAALDFTPSTDEELARLADELFQMSDAEEARRHGAA